MKIKVVLENFFQTGVELLINEDSMIWKTGRQTCNQVVVENWTDTGTAVDKITAVERVDKILK